MDQSDMNGNILGPLILVGALGALCRILESKHNVIEFIGKVSGAVFSSRIFGIANGTST